MNSTLRQHAYTKYPLLCTACDTILVSICLQTFLIRSIGITDTRGRQTDYIHTYTCTDHRLPNLLFVTLRTDSRMKPG